MALSPEQTDGYYDYAKSPRTYLPVFMIVLCKLRT
jgi:hypothetical protein